MNKPRCRVEDGYCLTHYRRVAKMDAEECPYKDPQRIHYPDPALLQKSAPPERDLRKTFGKSHPKCGSCGSEVTDTINPATSARACKKCHKVSKCRADGDFCLEHFGLIMKGSIYCERSDEVETTSRGVRVRKEIHQPGQHSPHAPHEQRHSGPGVPSEDPGQKRVGYRIADPSKVDSAQLPEQAKLRKPTMAVKSAEEAARDSINASFDAILKGRKKQDDASLRRDYERFMTEETTCPCGIYIHPSIRNYKAIHISDCPFAKDSQE